MNDRTPTKPGRVLITPESGAPYYAVLTMADEPTQDGDAPVKANLLTDAVADLWGGSSTSKVTDILKYAAARYGTCTTAAATAAKVVTLSDFALSVGAVIGVNFTNKNTASSPTLNVNGVGAKAVYFNGSVVSTSQVPKMAYFQYDGTYWQLLNGPAFQIATGSYTGTGTYGIENPVSLALPLDAKILIITAISGNSCVRLFFNLQHLTTSYQQNGYLLNGFADTIGADGSTAFRPISCYAKKDGNTISFFYYGTYAILQANSAITNIWVAIG